MPAKQDLQIIQGKTFSRIIRWEAEPYLYIPITAITNTAPVGITTGAPHGLPDGWRAAVVSVQGMTEINAKNSPPRASDYRPLTVIDSDQLEFNAINAAEFSTYTSGGYVQALTPVDLTGMTARMTIKDRIGGTELLALTTENGRIVIDNAAKTIQLLVDALTTAALTFVRGYFDLEMVSGSVVTALLYGNVVVTREVTT
jgi:hypothetical protein